MDRLVYDIETAREVEKVKGGWSNPWGMGIASAVVYSLDKDRYYFFLHEKSRSKLINFLNGHNIITYNGLNFDSKVVLGNDRGIKLSETKRTFMISGDHDGKKIIWRELDLYNKLVSKYTGKSVVEILGKPFNCGISLNKVAEVNLGISKTANGALAPVLYSDGKYDQLLEYNLQDVRITTRLYLFLLDKKYIINERKEIIDFRKGGK